MFDDRQAGVDAEGSAKSPHGWKEKYTTGSFANEAQKSKPDSNRDHWRISKPRNEFSLSTGTSDGVDGDSL